MRFIHLGDCHLDAPLCDLGRTFNYADLRRHEIKNTFSKQLILPKKKV
jgi:DNA repair exonuclease SbcCD nuclease subunit